MDDRARSAAATLSELPTESASVDRRLGHYVPDLIHKMLTDLD